MQNCFDILKDEYHYFAAIDIPRGTIVAIKKSKGNAEKNWQKTLCQTKRVLWP